MGLDIAMLGESTLVAMKKDATLEPHLRMLIAYCLKEYPNSKTLDFKEPSDIVKGGHKVGPYSDLHVLRGVAVASEKRVATIATLAESDLEAIVTAFYAGEKQETLYPHLLFHADDSGFYVPFELPHPMRIEGVPRGEDEQVSISFGSSMSLLHELNELNRVLDLPGDIGEVGEEKFDALAEQHRWPTAASVWGVLRLYARESVARTGFIQFC